ncbi:C3a anaphylatoxin chemotactic receptor-like [Engystomops pustulosus]|uniref:C3a anaphylatoxin chemotactic receptor-like n=1 Tax=Engystomops pustulosus TaxID=76066 RepID=UPI003AFB4A50
MVAISLYSVIFVLGIIGNGLVIWIAGFRMKKTISAIWFLHLAIADCMCCASLPLQIARWATINLCLSSISLGTLCMLSIILFKLNMSASVLLLTAMSVDRWVSVMWPFWAKVHRTQKLVRITAGIIWVISFIFTGLVFYFFYFRSYYSNFVENTGHINDLIRLVLMFVIPFLIISTSYVTIFLKIKNSNRPQRSQRPYRIITAVILCFFFCWFPSYIWPLLPMFNGDDVQLNIVDIVVVIPACLNSCINPIIYVFMGQDFRHGFLRSIPSRLKEAISEHPIDPCREQEDLDPPTTTDV